MYSHVNNKRAKSNASCRFLCSEHATEMVLATAQQILWVAPLCKHHIYVHDVRIIFKTEESFK